MKDFLKKHKRWIFFIAIILLIAAVLTTTAISQFTTPYNNRADLINTCSIPTGKIVSRGIDVSRYQGDIDFEQVKSDGYTFVILRVGTSIGGKDSMFETYYKKAKEAGLHIGCYYYTYESTPKMAKREARQVLKYIKGKSFTYPVFFDFEHPELLASHRNETNTKMIDKFCKVIKRGGYYPGVYTSYSIYTNHLDCEAIGSNWDVWIANYRDNTPDYTGYQDNFSMWQYTNKGAVSGISTDVDLNVCYVDYPSIIDEFNISYSKLDN